MTQYKKKEIKLSIKLFRDFIFTHYKTRTEAAEDLQIDRSYIYRLLEANRGIQPWLAQSIEKKSNGKYKAIDLSPKLKYYQKKLLTKLNNLSSSSRRA